MLETQPTLEGPTSRHTQTPSRRPIAGGRRTRRTGERLLGPEIELAGFFFESQAIHDLRVYAQVHRADVRFYRDNKGLEVDAVIEATDGRWIALEMKLGHHRVDEAAANLHALQGKLPDTVNAQCGALVVVTADTPTYTRPDGVIVTSLAALGP